MANETVPSDLGQGLVRENWGPRYISALYEQHAVLPHFLNITGDYKRGDIANIPIAPTLTVGDTDLDGSLDVQVATHTNVQVSIDKNKNVTVELTGIAREQAEASFENDFPQSAGDAMRQQMESDALALQSSVTNTAIGDGLGNLGEDELLAAVQAAITAKLPAMEKPGEFCFALADNQYAPLRKLKILDFNVTGEAGKGGAASAKIAELWGIPVKFSTQVATSTYRKNLFFHKNAFAWATQRNVVPKMADRLAGGKDSYIMTVLGLYGVKLVTQRAWVINSKA